MSKIAIISQPDQGVLIDVSGCTTLKEALEHLSSTLQVSNQFWHGMHVSVNLGALPVSKDELKNILAIAKAVGISPTGVYSTNDETRDALRKSNIPLGSGKPMTLPAVSMDPTKVVAHEIEDDSKKAGPLASITMRVVDAMARRGQKEVPAAPLNEELEEMKQEEFEDIKPAASKDPESPFPHVKAKRKVSLDGRKVEVTADQPKAEKAGKPEAAEAAGKGAKAPKIENVESAEEVDGDITLKISPEEKYFAPTVEMKVPPDVVEDVVAATPVSAEKTQTSVERKAVTAEISPVSPEKTPVAASAQVSPEEPVSKEEQEITGPHVEVKVMNFNVADGMFEAQPAQQALAQAATITGDIVTQVDLESHIVDSKVGQTIVDDDDIENAEEYDLAEELETDTLDMEIASRGGPTTLYLRQNLRSGQTVSHKGHLVIIGDINPGAEVMADGDITVWGCLRGVAHAGIGGNVNAEIRALKLQPIQIRIAHAIARAPDRPRVNYATSNGPETARMVDGKIKVVKSRLD